MEEENKLKAQLIRLQAEMYQIIEVKQQLNAQFKEKKQKASALAEEIRKLQASHKEDVEKKEAVKS